MTARNNEIVLSLVPKCEGPGAPILVVDGMCEKATAGPLRLRSGYASTARGAKTRRAALRMTARNNEIVLSLVPKCEGPGAPILVVDGMCEKATAGPLRLRSGYASTARGAKTRRAALRMTARNNEIVLSLVPKCEGPGAPILVVDGMCEKATAGPLRLRSGRAPTAHGAKTRRAALRMTARNNEIVLSLVPKCEGPGAPILVVDGMCEKATAGPLRLRSGRAPTAHGAKTRRAALRMTARKNEIVLSLIPKCEGPGAPILVVDSIRIGARVFIRRPAPD
jgi:hypothetical protein